MAGFDPNLRHETWLFLKTPTGEGVKDGNKRMRRMRYNLVEYDGVPEQFIEPVPPSDFFFVTGTSLDVVRTSATDATGRCVGVQVFDIPPFDGLHHFN